MIYRNVIALFRCLTVLLLAANVSCTALAATVPQQPDTQPEVESSVVVRGRTSYLVVVGKTLSALKSVEIEPPTGVKVVEIKKAEMRPDGLMTIAIVLAVAAEAEIGQRTATLLAKDNRMDIVFFSIGTHSLTISNLKLESKRQEIIKMEETERVIAEALYSFNFEDEAGDITADEAAASIQIMLQCGRTGSGFYSVPTKVVLDTPNRGTIYVTLHKDQLAHAKPECELQFRLKDKDGNESNRLKTTLPFPVQ